MWIKLFLLLVYICLLFLLSRLLETFSWCDLGPSKVLSRQLLDPMRLSVAKLKCLLDHRGVSYDGIVEKSELTSLVDASGPVTMVDVDMSCQEEAPLSETNFTSGAHFIEQVEDAKDSVWLVQVVTKTDQVNSLVNRRWKNIQQKASHFGVRTGLLDCSLDVRYCYSKGWRMPVMLLALPRVFEKKANVIMYNYSGPATESAVMRWIHDKLDARIVRVGDLSLLHLHEDQAISLRSLKLQPEIQALLLTQALSAPLFFSALSVKFPGRVKFGLVTMDESKTKRSFLKKLTNSYKNFHLPMFIIYTAEGNYTYGLRQSEKFSFSNMETFLKFLYPCLNDIFIISFCFANVMSWLELFVSNCGVFRRIRKFIWCVLKYNIIVIMLWLPVIGIFQMPYLDQVPLLLLKLHRIFTISDIGAILRGDYVFYAGNPLYVYLSFIGYLALVTFMCNKYREVEDDTEDWFNFRQMQTFTHLRANNLFEPMRVSSYDLVGGFEVFGSRFSQHSIWLQPTIPLEYIQHLPTWRYTPQTMASRAAQNVVKVQSAMVNAACETSNSKHETETKPNKTSDGKDVACGKQTCGAYAKCFDQNTAALSPSAAPSVETSSVNVLRQPNCKYSCSHLNQECQHTSEPCRVSPFDSQVPLPSKDNITDAGSQSSARVDSSNFNPCHPIDPSITTTDQSSSTNTPQLPEEITGATSTAPPSTSNQHHQHDVLPSGFRKGFMESTQCVICLEEYAPLTMLCGLPCGHVFHETCIISWLNREKHFCPMCRWPSYKLVVTPNPL